MKGIQSHTHAERTKIVQKIIPIIKKKFRSNLIAFAADGSYARGEDVDYSDIELVVFLKKPLAKKWEIRKIIDGMLVVVVSETKESYLRTYLDVSNIWYASGAGKLLPIINKHFVEEVNSFIPADRTKKCLQQIEVLWHRYQEITAKVLNSIKVNNTDACTISFYEMIKQLLIILSYLNETPYITFGKYITQAREFVVKPKGFDALLSIVMNGTYQNVSKVETVVKEVFSDLENIVEKKGVKLYSREL